ncbi:MAG: type II toxin-antitoxin system Phd/YefM family antitoxin [Clostridiaceae bacterium]|nr:type II toxin-antitoxin system Phd/YefM family antitoxin [Clostridiaceae bacterium]
MQYSNITNFRKNIYKLLEETIKYNEPLQISTKDGNAIVLSEDDYNSLIETLYLTSVPGMKEIIKDGLATSISDCISEDEVEW